MGKNRLRAASNEDDDPIGPNPSRGGNANASQPGSSASVEESVTLSQASRQSQNTNVQNASASVEERLGNRFDLTQASRQSLDTDNPKVPMFKNFRVTYENGGDETPEIIRVHKNDTTTLLQRVVAKFYEFKLDMKKIEITYPVRTQNSTSTGGETWKVKWIPDEVELKESLNALYVYAEPDSHLIIRDIVKRPSKARSSKPSEKLYKEYKEIKTVSRQSYEILMEDEDIIDKYFEKVRIVQIMLNSTDSINLLSPSHFVCPLVDCKGKKTILLRSFNNLSSIEDHLLKHDVKDTDNQAAKTLLNRYQCLNKTDFIHKTRQLSIAEASVKLDNTQYEGGDTDSRKLGQLFLPTLQSEFRGKHYHTKHSILQRILNHEETPLAGVPVRKANSFFAKRNNTQKRPNTDTEKRPNTDTEKRPNTQKRPKPKTDFRISPPPSPSPPSPPYEPK